VFQTKEELIKSYQSSYELHGVTPEGVNMQEAEQSYRFLIATKLLLSMCEERGLTEISLLDVGCGFCDLLKYLEVNTKLKIRYTGVDVVPEYIKFYKDNQGHEVLLHDILEQNLNTSYDFVVGLAILSRKTVENHLERMIDRMAYHANYGVIFDCNSSLNYIGNFEKYSPAEVINLVSVISKKFSLTHDPKIKNMFFGIDVTNSAWRIGKGGTAK
jgi:2-polyprenyl-3-methyl-5-hydroxy-6-metoxy-1,4-benzoquinol methylase